MDRADVERRVWKHVVPTLTPAGGDRASDLTEVHTANHADNYRMIKIGAMRRQDLRLP